MSDLDRSAQAVPAVGSPLHGGVRPVAEVCCARLRWHLPTQDSDPVRKFLDNRTHLLYDQGALDVAVAAERKKALDALKERLDGTVMSKYASLAECEAARSALRNAMLDVWGA